MGFFITLFGQDSIELTGKHWVERGVGSANDNEMEFELGLPRVQLHCMSAQ